MLLRPDRASIDSRVAHHFLQYQQPARRLALFATRVSPGAGSFEGIKAIFGVGLCISADRTQTHSAPGAGGPVARCLNAPGHLGRRGRDSDRRRGFTRKTPTAFDPERHDVLQFRQPRFRVMCNGQFDNVSGKFRGSVLPLMRSERPP